MHQYQLCSQDQRLAFALIGVIVHMLRCHMPTFMAYCLWLCRPSVLLRRLRFLRRPHPPYPCHHPFVLPLPLPGCLIYELPTYSESKIAVLVKSTDRISHTIAELDFTNHSIAFLQTSCRQTHTLMMPTGHVCLKPSKAVLLWFHIGCTTCAL